MAEEAQESIVTQLDLASWETPFYYTGMTTATRRFVGIGGLTALALYLAKPKALFMPSGRPRGWKVTSSKEPGAVYIPWWGYAAIAGGLAAVLV